MFYQTNPTIVNSVSEVDRDITFSEVDRDITFSVFYPTIVNTRFAEASEIRQFQTHLYRQTDVVVHLKLPKREGQNGVCSFESTGDCKKMSTKCLLVLCISDNNLCHLLRCNLTTRYALCKRLRQWCMVDSRKTGLPVDAYLLQRLVVRLHLSFDHGQPFCKAVHDSPQGCDLLL